MAKHYNMNIAAHKNIYSGSTERMLRVECAIPNEGTNSDTGFIVLIPGFGGHIDSNVYKKMRDVFADQYNVVTVQCAYFGHEFMQGCENFALLDELNSILYHCTHEELIRLRNDFTQFSQILATKPIHVAVAANLQETEELFADMGIMQAIDHIYAVESVMNRLEEQNLPFNRRRVIGFGQSHGSYLLHLCNRLSPHLFEMIIDNSAWVVPAYLNGNRMLLQPLGQAVLHTEFFYLARDYIHDKDALHLKNLYRNFENGAYIFSFIGTDDNLVDLDDKAAVLESISFVEHEVIDASKVDGVMFKSARHGLDSDFLALTDYVLNRGINHRNSYTKVEQYEIVSSNVTIKVDYSGSLPAFLVIGI